MRNKSPHPMDRNGKSHRLPAVQKRVQTAFRFCLISGWVFAAAFLILVSSASAAPRAQHVFIISIDGGKPAVIAQSSMPELSRLVTEGGCTWEARTINPSITLPSHTSMLTGVEPRKHKVTWNTWKPGAGTVQVPTVFSIAKEAGFSTAMFVGKEKFKHLLVPNSVDHFEFDEAMGSAVVTSVVGDSKPRKTSTVSAKIVAASAASHIRNAKPDLCFIHFTDPDDAGHKHGWGSPQQIKAFADVDQALAQVTLAIRDAGLAKSSVLIITADHGGHAKTHGGKTPDDMTIPWIVWGCGVKNQFSITSPVNTCDTTATALWLLGIPQPRSLQGLPVKAAFSFAD